MKHPYCEKCNKIVPESEVKDLFKTGNLMHHYTRMVNAYKNQSPGMIGFCPETEHVYCGKIREATPEEYFICNLIDSSE